MTFHISDIRAIRLFVSFVILSADFITNYAFGRMTRILTGYFLASPETFIISQIPEQRTGIGYKEVAATKHA